MDIDDIKAGTYLLIAPQWEQYLSKPNEPFDFMRHRRGAVLELNVEDARRLYAAGAVLPHDPEHPTHVVDPDGTVREVLPADPAATGMVIPEEYFNVLADQLGISPDATSEDLVRAVLAQREQTEAAKQQAAEAEARAQALASSGDPAPVDRPKSDRIKDIVEWVAGDKAKAQLALDGERSSKGDRARPELIAALEETLTAPAGGA